MPGLPWHGRGHRFDPGRAHRFKKLAPQKLPLSATSSKSSTARTTSVYTDPTHSPNPPRALASDLAACLIRLMVRVLTPRISAACHNVICFDIARITISCTFIARSTAAARYCSSCIFTSERNLHPLPRKADRSCANDSGIQQDWHALAGIDYIS